MKIQSKSKLLFIGDSITDCGRQRPIGEGRGDTYGTGYVNLIRGLLAVEYTAMRIRVVNMGVGGNTVRDLKARWQSDVMDLKPDWVSIMIGINDIWRQFDNPLMTEIHIGLDAYCMTLDNLVSSTMPHVSGVILMTPFFMEPNADDAMRRMTDAYSNAVYDIAKKYNTVFVDSQSALDSLTAHIPQASIGWDRVHPDVQGHMAVAKAFMKAII